MLLLLHLSASSASCPPAAPQRLLRPLSAGYTGEDCSKPLKRPCSNRHAEDDEVHPTSHTGSDGRDLNWTTSGWLAGRCAGEGQAALGTATASRQQPQL